MPSTSARIILRVDPAIAEAYEKASPAERAHARSVFAFSLLSREDAAEETLQYLDEVARKARGRGLTPELLDDILNEAPTHSSDEGRGKADGG